MAQRHCKSAGTRPALSGAREFDILARHPGRFDRISWRRALGSIVSVAERLHHYRSLRTKMMHEALHDRDDLSEDANVE
jgi:hypothetical protein